MSILDNTISQIVALVRSQGYDVGVRNRHIVSDGEPIGDIAFTYGHGPASYVGGIHVYPRGTYKAHSSIPGAWVNAATNDGVEGKHVAIGVDGTLADAAALVVGYLNERNT